MEDSSYDDETNSYDEEEDDDDEGHCLDGYKSGSLLPSDLALNKIQHPGSSNPQ